MEVGRAFMVARCPLTYGNPIKKEERNDTCTPIKYSQRYAQHTAPTGHHRALVVGPGGIRAAQPFFPTVPPG